MPHRGQYGATRWSSTSSPLSWICLSAHQTDSTYDEDIVVYGWSMSTQ